MAALAFVYQGRVTVSEAEATRESALVVGTPSANIASEAMNSLALDCVQRNGPV